MTVRRRWQHHLPACASRNFGTDGPAITVPIEATVHPGPSCGLRERLESRLVRRCCNLALRADYRHRGLVPAATTTSYARSRRIASRRSRKPQDGRGDRSFDRNGDRRAVGSEVFWTRQGREMVLQRPLLQSFLSMFAESRQLVGFTQNTAEFDRFCPPQRCAGGYDFGMVPADFEAVFWAGRASFLCARRSRGDWRRVD